MSKIKNILIIIIISSFNLTTTFSLNNDSYAKNNNSINSEDDSYFDNEDNTLNVIEQGCPKKRLVTPAPEEYQIKKNPLRKEPRNLKKGKVLYRLKAKKACKYCHGMEGRGDGSQADLLDSMPRNLTCKKYMSQISDGDLFWVIKNGIVETDMPSYNHLSDKKIWQLIQYIRTFSS